MGLSEYEQMVLRRLDADLARRDPQLRSRLAEFTALENDAGVTWRPPRAAVVLAAVMLAGAGFMLATVTMLMRQPCRVTATGAQATTKSMAPARPATPAGRRPGSPAPGMGDRPVAPARPSPPTC